MLAMREKCDRFEEERQTGCESCRTHAVTDAQCRTELAQLAASNKQLTNDIKMMKTLIYRLNVQLERYQEMIRKKCRDNGEPPIRDSAALAANAVRMEETVDWGGIETNVLAPLLNAYQEMINDKTELVWQHEMELNRVAGRFKDILVENEQLHVEMDAMQRARDAWMEEQTRLQAQLDVCRNQAEVHSKRADLAKEKLMEVLRCYEQKIQAHTIDMERLQEAYSRLKGEQITCKTMHQQPELVVEKLKECQKLLNDTKVQHLEEKAKLMDELSEAKNTNQKLETQAQTRSLEIAELKSTIQTLNEKIE